MQIQESFHGELVARIHESNRFEFGFAYPLESDINWIQQVDSKQIYTLELKIKINEQLRLTYWKQSEQ